MADPFVGRRIGLLARRLLGGDAVKRSSIPSLLSLACCTKGCGRQDARRYTVRVRSACIQLSHDVTSLLRLVRHGIKLRGMLFYVASANCTSPRTTGPNMCQVPNNRFCLGHYTTLLGVCLVTSCNRKRCIRTCCSRRVCLGRGLVRGGRLDLARVRRGSTRFLIRFDNIDRMCSTRHLLLNP